MLARNRRNARDDAVELRGTGPLEAEGMRERKKRERRDAIAAHALRLFADNGFERVSMREIAQVADVSEPTVFNYFPTKENLVFNEDRERELALLQAVRDRPPASSVVAAFRDQALKLLTAPARNRYGLVPSRAGESGPAASPT